MESALITTPPISSAKASAWCDLPLAVGPAIRTASYFMARTMFVLNVIGKGAEPGLFRGLDYGPANILSPRHAFDLPIVDSGALAEARARCDGLALDINLVATAQRRKKL